MKFITSSSQISNILQKIGSIITSNNTSIPILDNFLFEIEKENLKIIASDLETTIISSLKIDASDNFKVTIQSKLLIDILKTLPEQPINFSFDKKTNMLKLGSEYGEYSLSYEPNYDLFPKVPKIEDKKQIKIPSKIFKTVLNKTLFATSNDELKPTISGLLFDIKNDSITFVATDTYKLTKYKVNLNMDEQNKQLIVPKKPLSLIKTFIENQNEDEDIIVEYDDKNIKFILGSTNLIIRLISGKYPNYEAVIPKDNDKILIIEKNILLNSIKRLSLFSNKSNNQINFSITKSTINLSTEDIDFSKKGDEKLNCNYDGEDIKIGFNSKFLIETLSNNIDNDDSIRIEMSQPNKAILIKNNSKEQKDEEHLSLVMPIILI